MKRLEVRDLSIEFGARKVVDRAREEGVRSAVGAARERLEALAPLGYSSAGFVSRVGAGVTGLAPGNRVADGPDALVAATRGGVGRSRGLTGVLNPVARASAA